MNITKANLKPGNIAVMAVDNGFIKAGARVLLLQNVSHLTAYDWYVQDLSDPMERFCDGRWFLHFKDLMDF